MAYSGANVLSAPVTISDIAGCIMASAPDNTKLSALCTHENVNFWAKYKPISAAIIDTVTGQWDASSKEWKSSATWWKSRSLLTSLKCCGFDVPYYTNVANLLANYETDQWAKLPPTGGSSSPYRQSDFAGYKHDCVCPFSISMPGQIVVTSAGQTTAKIMTLTPTMHALNLRLQDVIGDFYFGVVVKIGSNTPQWKTFDTLNVGGALVLQDLSLSGVSSITAVVMATNHIHTDWVTVDETARFYSLQAYNLGSQVSAEIPVVTAADPTFYIVVNASGWRMTGSAYLDGGTTVRGNLQLKKKGSKEMYLDSITITATQNSTGEVKGTSTVTITGAQLDALTLDMTIGHSYGFYCDYVNMGLPALSDVTDNYTYTYTFNYIQ